MQHVTALSLTCTAELWLNWCCTAGRSLPLVPAQPPPSWLPFSSPEQPTLAGLLAAAESLVCTAVHTPLIQRSQTTAACQLPGHHMARTTNNSG
jgi:hypothetical protein